MNRPLRDALALVFASTFPLVSTWLYFIVFGGQSSNVVIAVYGIAKTFQFAFPIVYVALFDRDRLLKRLCFVQVALHGFGNSVRPDDARRLHAGPDGSPALGARAGLARPEQHDCRPSTDPLRPGTELHNAVLPQLLRQHS